MTAQSVAEYSSVELALAEHLAAAIAHADPGLTKRMRTDPAAHLDLVVLTARAHTQTTRMLQSAVTAARSAGHSWEAIGRALGMTRQAAQQRFGAGAASTSTQDTVSGAERRIISPLTAVDEIEVLNRAGRAGWHSVGFGALYHVVERSDRQWEHIRVLALGRQRRRLEQDGWQRIGSMWFPWTYYKRSLGLPVERGTDVPAVLSMAHRRAPK